MIKKTFIIKYDGAEHTLKYACNSFLGTISVNIDGDEYRLRSKFLFIGIARKEALIIGGGRAMLDIDCGGHAKLIMRDAEIIER